MPESCCSSKQVLLKAVPESCPKLLPKAVPRSCSPKLFPSAAVQSYCPKAAILQVYTPEWFPKAAPYRRYLYMFVAFPSCSTLPKVAAESCCPKWFVKLPQKLLPKAAVLQNNCSSKLFRKACQSCSLKLLPKAVPQSTSAKRLTQSGYASNLFPKAFPKAILQSGSRKLLPKVAAESCSPKLRPKATPQRCSPFKAAVQSCSGSPKLLPKAAPQTCSTKLFPKAVPQTCYRKLLRTAAKPAPESCFQKRYPKVAF